MCAKNYEKMLKSRLSYCNEKMASFLAHPVYENIYSTYTLYWLQTKSNHKLHSQSNINDLLLH